MRFFAPALVLAALVLRVAAQTITTIDQFGETVVEVITVDPNLGVPVTETLETLTSTTAPATTTTTTQAGQVGPVGAPPATTEQAGETLYTYTTTDANGNTIAVEATFTPSFAATSVFATPPPGTVLDYSSWKAAVGTNTVAAISSSRPRFSLQTTWVSIAAAVCASLTGGAWLALA